MPDDTWILRPQDVPDGFRRRARTLGIFRASPARSRNGRAFTAARCRSSCSAGSFASASNAGEIVLDPFAGSGTTLVAAKKLGRRWIGFDLSADYVAKASERLTAADEGDLLEGPADPVRSAPPTPGSPNARKRAKRDADSGPELFSS